MKTICLAFLVCIMAACNNEKSSETVTKDTTTSSDTKASGSAEGKCASLYVFREGAVVENASYDENGKETSRQTSNVLKVTNDGSSLNSEVQMKTSGTDTSNVFTGKYRCDGKNLYVDLSSLFANMESKGATMQGDAIVFPIDLTEGQTLPDATYAFSMDAQGQQMKTKVTVKDRKVTGRETITTPAGTFNCYKITANIDADVDFPGMDEKTKKMLQSMKSSMPKQRVAMYFDPSVSIVRVEMFSNDKLQNRSDVVSIKK